MEKDIQEIKISVALLQAGQKHANTTLDEIKGSIPVCEKAVIKTSVAANSKLSWWTFILIFGSIITLTIRALAQSLF